MCEQEPGVDGMCFNIGFQVIIYSMMMIIIMIINNNIIL